MTFLAICRPCSKQFRVPHDRKEWNCKQCNGVLELKAEAEDKASGCIECGVDLAVGAHFCEACGADQGGGEEYAQARKRREVTQSNVEMRKASKPLDVLQLMLKVALGVATLSLLGFIMLLRDDWQSLEQSTKVVGYFRLAEVFVLVLALWQLRRRPLPVTLTLTVLRILELTFVLMVAFDAEESVINWPGMVKYILFTVFYIFATVEAAKLTRLAKENPDAYLARKMRGEVTSRPGRDGARKRSRPRNESSSQLMVGAGVIVFFVLVFIGRFAWSSYSQNSSVELRSDVPTMVTDDFSAAWNTQDFEGLSGFAAEGSEAKFLKLFSGLAERYGWGDDWPMITGLVPDQKGSSTKIYFETEAGYLPIRFKQSGNDAWRIQNITLTEIKKWGG